MNRKSLNLLETHERSYKFLMDNAAIWNAYKPMTKPVKDLETAIQTRRAALMGQQQQSEGATKGKQDAQQKAATAVVSLAKFANAYAMANHDTDLYAQTRRSKSYLMELPDAQGVAVMRQMLKSIKPQVEALADYGVTPEDFMKAEQLVAVAEAALSAPRSVVDEKKTAGQNIPAAERLGSSALTFIDRVIHYFEKTNPDFVKTYRNSRVKIDRPGGYDGDDGPQPPLGS